MKNNNLIVLFAGDFCPINRIEQLCIDNLEYQISEEFIDCLGNKDLSIANLECPLTESNNKISKLGPNLAAKKKAVNALVACKFDVVTLSNNHIKDFGDEGISDTINVLRRNKIKHVGAGYNLEQARRPLELILKDKKICILNYSDPEFANASANSSGSNPFDLINVICDIKIAKQRNDIIFVVIHG